LYSLCANLCKGTKSAAYPSDHPAL
jgi:hypothetical protein